MKSRGFVAFFLILAIYLGLPNCSAFGLLDKLENPGGGITTQSLPKVFVSSAITTGNIKNFATCGDNITGNHSNADCACQKLAAAAGLANSGRFVAWLSDPQNDARCRVQGIAGNICSTSTGGPWYDTKGNLVAQNVMNLTTGALSAPIQYNEAGLGPVAGNVYTGTTVLGVAGTNVAPGTSCGSWTTDVGGTTSATVGVATSTSTTWTDTAAAQTCNAALFLPVYCFEAPIVPATAL